MKELQKINVTLIWVVTVALIVYNVALGVDSDTITKAAISMITTSVIVTVVYYISMPDRLKSVLITSINGLATLICSIVFGGNSDGTLFRTCNFSYVCNLMDCFTCSNKAW